MPAEPSGVTGEGYPCGAVGYPSYELFFDVLPDAGWQWYALWLGSATYVDLTTLQVWNPFASNGAGAWTVYNHARMWRPNYERLVWGGLGYENVKIRFTELY